MNDQDYSIAQQPVEHVAAPGIGLLLRESRLLIERGRFALQSLPEGPEFQGQGQPIVLLPGFGASDRHMKPLIRALDGLGFSAHGWAQGYNWGMRGKVKLALAERLQRLCDDHGQKVALLGWSLGGVFAREIARHQSEQVSMVFTLGSPINGHPNANNVAKLFNLINPGKKADGDLQAFQKRRVPPPVPCVAIHSKTDGIVAWQCAREVAAPNTENIEVRGSHFGLPCNTEVLRAVARRLARHPAHGR